VPELSARDGLGPQAGSGPGTPTGVIQGPASPAARTMPSYRACSQRVTGPGTPLPTGSPSTATTGSTSARVPQSSTSSATYSSVRSISRRQNRRPTSSWARPATVARVMPSSAPLVAGGVRKSPSRTIATLAPGDSATVPRWLRIRAVA
jgi:hypothetical protein